LDSFYPVVFMDAIHFKVREEGHIVTKAAYIALGINGEGYKDILGIWIGENEGAKFWLKVCNELKNRGVEDILIVCIDGLKGFPKWTIPYRDWGETYGQFVIEFGDRAKTA